MPQRIAGTVVVDGTDDEYWPENDEHIHKQFSVQIVLDENQPLQPIELPDVRWGGECRVELKLTGRLLSHGGAVIEGVVKLYEGITEESDDLDDEKTVAFLVPNGGAPTFHRVQLRNSEAFGGDHAEIGFSFTNNSFA